MPRGVAHDHEAKKAALRKGAAAYFAANGYNRASMSNLARSCGVSKALLYHYYDSKEALLFDILNEHLSSLLTVVACAQSGGLKVVVHSILTAYADADAEHKLQLDALNALPDHMQGPLIGLQRQLVEKMGAALAAERRFEPDRQRALTMSVFGILNWFYMWHRPDKGLSRSEYADLATEFILGGLHAIR